MREHGHEGAKEETHPAGQSTAQAEPDGPSQKTQRDFEQPRPQEDAHQAKREQAHRSGHKSAKNTRQDDGRKRPEEKARPAQSGTRGGSLPKRKSFIRVEWKRLFPKAPNWSPASKLTAPVIVVGHRDPRWWSIRWKKDLKLFEVRVQDRLLFRNAPRWSPFYGMTAPALHFTLKKSKWKAMKRSHESKRSAQEKGQSKDHGHSH